MGEEPKMDGTLELLFSQPDQSVSSRFNDRLVSKNKLERLWRRSLCGDLWSSHMHSHMNRHTHPMCTYPHEVGHFNEGGIPCYPSQEPPAEPLAGHVGRVCREAELAGLV